MHPRDAEITRIKINEDRGKIAEQYFNAQKDYATHKFNYHKLLGERVASSPKMSLEKIIIQALGEHWASRQEFEIAYNGYLYNKALTRGLEQKLKHLEGELSSLQSYLKYLGNND